MGCSGCQGDDKPRPTVVIDSAASGGMSRHVAAPDSTPCDCPAASGTAWCGRHRRTMADRQRQLCRERLDYFDLWASQAAQQRPRGAGDRLADLLHRLGLAALQHRWAAWRGRECGCEARRRWLNRLWPF